MIGFETIGNATITFFDDKPVLSTDPWLFGNPYFGSWGHKYKIPKEQIENIKNSKYIFLSHGHPDHIDPDSLDFFKDNTFILADHYGDRIYNDLKKKFNCIKLKSNTWFEVSENIRIKTFADWNQDSCILVEVLKKDIILNLNDGNALGWSKEVKKIVNGYKNKFLLKLINWGDSDMINIYDKHNQFITPFAASKPPLGETYNYYMKKWNCNYAVPFSTFHTYVRNDSSSMNKFVSPLEAHTEKFDEKKGTLLPAFIKWDFLKNDYSLINPSLNEDALKDSKEFGDNWSDQLDKQDEKKIFEYFDEFDYLKEKFGFLNFRIGKKDFNIKLSNRQEGIKFETPRNSLMTSIKYNIFDDLLIGNFAKVQLINVSSLYPDFNPYVSKYGDNGGARSTVELKNYFDYYKLNSANYWIDFLKLKTEEIIRTKLSNYKKIYSLAREVKRKF